MFDPTAFDNMKVVAEGLFYDLDLNGVISIKERNDIIDLAQLSRNYSLSFSLNERSNILATFRLYASLEQLSAELLAEGASTQRGAFLEVVYSGSEQDMTKEMIRKWKAAWGQQRMFETRYIDSSLSGKSIELVVRFERLITEDMMEDLQELIEFFVATLQN
ncbi:MAG: hypothetical protein IMW92_14825 [Bacillales bacterium]|nr:hypothetical protein [Bacillales bacterium]